MPKEDYRQQSDGANRGLLIVRGCQQRTTDSQRVPTEDYWQSGEGNRELVTILYVHLYSQGANSGLVTEAVNVE